jgi:hypothetical protein
MDRLTDLVVENTGQTMATDVTVRFDPPLVSTLNEVMAWEESGIFDNGLATLPPANASR